MTLNIGDVMRMTVTGSGELNAVWQNVTHYEMTSGAGIAEADAMDTAELAYQAAWAVADNNIANTYEAELLTFWVRDVSLGVWNGIGTRAQTGLVGVSAGDPEPHGVAAVGFLNTELLRRSGRTFLPGMVESSIVNGLFSGAVLTNTLAYLALYWAALAPTGGVLTPCTYNTTPGSPYEETSSLSVGTVTATNVPGYQRRRKPGVGI